MIYDLNREDIDGRKQIFYIENLRKLLSLFPDLIIFHDINSKSLEDEFKRAKFVRLPLKDLKIYYFLKEIEDICEKYSKAGSLDLVFKLPLYGILVNSKFELLQRSLAFTNSKSIAWVDAGIMRFMDEDKYVGFHHRTSELPSEVFELDLWNAIKTNKYDFSCLKFKQIKIGTSYRLIGASFFILNRSVINKWDRSFYALIENSISNFEWDTEQVFITRMLSPKNSSLCLQKRGSPTSLFFEYFFNSSKLKIIKYPFTKLFF